MKYSPPHAVAVMAVAAVASMLLGAAHVEARECFTSDLMPHLHFTTTTATTTTAATTTATTTARWIVPCAYLDDSVCHLSPEGCMWLDQDQACVKRVDGDSTATTSAATSVTTTNTSVVVIPDDCATLTVGVRKDFCKWRLPLTHHKIITIAMKSTVTPCTKLAQLNVLIRVSSLV